MAINGKVPEYISAMFRYVSDVHKRTTRQTCKKDLYIPSKSSSLQAYVAISRFDIFLGRFLSPMSKRIYKIHWSRKKWVPGLRLTFRASILNFKMATTVFCPGLKKDTVLLEGKGHFRVRNYILRALLHTELHFEGTFVRGIVIMRKKMVILLVQCSNHIFG